MPGARTQKCLGPIFQTVYCDRRVDFFFDFSSRSKVDVVSLSLGQEALDGMPKGSKGAVKPLRSATVRPPLVSS